MDGAGCTPSHQSPVSDAIHHHVALAPFISYLVIFCHITKPTYLILISVGPQWQLSFVPKAVDEMWIHQSKLQPFLTMMISFETVF